MGEQDEKAQEQAQAQARALGFDGAEQRRLADELVAQCAGFTGLGEKLAGRSAKAAGIPAIAFEPGLVVFPSSALRDLPAGVAGRLGMALMGAASKMGKPAAPSFFASSASLDEPSVAEAPIWARPDGAFGRAAQADPGAEPPAPRFKRPPVEEGEGADSLDRMVGALEASGFGDPEVAKLIAANLAKPKARTGPGR